MKRFIITEHTTPIDIAMPNLTPDQQERATQSEYVFRFRPIYGRVGDTASRLPKYILDAIIHAGYAPIIIGQSTYKYTLIGLERITTP